MARTEKIAVRECWYAMWRRCTNESCYDYKHYGGRGISVCDRWRDLSAFSEDMGPRPSKSHSLDRIDVDGDYEPSNCRWADRLEQQRNKRNLRFLTVKGETKCLAEWAETSEIKANTILRRVLLGWDHESAIKTPLRTKP